MAEAARSVRHYVSDCLAERHPYDVQKGFAGNASRDSGKVFDGCTAAGGLDGLLNALTDASVGDEERAKAVRFLYSHSASQEAKIQLISKSAVPSTVAVLNRPCPAFLEQQCFQLLWSLCVVSQGCYAVVCCGGIEAAASSIENTETDAQHNNRADARAAAANVLAQVAGNFAGVRWMLQTEDCSEMALTDTEYPAAAGLPASTAATPSLCGPPPALVLNCVASALQSEPFGESRVSLLCATALARMTSLAPGVQLVLQTATSAPGSSCSGTSVLTSLPHQLAYFAGLTETLVMTAENEGRAVCQDQQLGYLVQILTVVWNIAMDSDGAKQLDDTGVPLELFHLFASVQRARVTKFPLLVQRALLGAMSAVHKLTGVKLASTALLAEDSTAVTGVAPTRIDALLRYLQDVNAAVSEQEKGGNEVCSDLIAISKNTVQCIRLASEVKAVRDITHRFLSDLDGQPNSNEGFYFRRQLYCKTAWEGEYHAEV